MTEIQRTAERKSAFVRARIKKICRKAIIYILLTLGAFSFVLPFLWMLSTSFKEYGEIFTYPITWIPRKWTIENYREVFSVSEYVNLWRGFLNTMLIVVPSTTAGVFSLIGKQDDNNLYSMMLSVDLLRIIWFYIILMLKISTLRCHILDN